MVENKKFIKKEKNKNSCSAHEAPVSLFSTTYKQKT